MCSIAAWASLMLSMMPDDKAIFSYCKLQGMGQLEANVLLFCMQASHAAVWLTHRTLPCLAGMDNAEICIACIDVMALSCAFNLLHKPVNCACMQTL